MRASELRLGNLIQYCNDADGSPIHTVKVIDETSVNHAILELYKPIPLTEEWLLKFGFEKGYKVGQSLNYFYLKENKYGTHYVAKPMGGTGGYHIFRGFPNGQSEAECYYVHQLQNLFHALTGEELQIKENFTDHYKDDKPIYPTNKTRW